MESYCIFSKQRDCTVCLVLGLEKKQESQFCSNRKSSWFYQQSYCIAALILHEHIMKIFSV